MTCGAFQGARCLTQDGHYTRPHVARRYVASLHVTENVNGAKVVRRVSEPIGADNE